MTDQSKPDQMSDARALVDLIRNAVKFANLAAGEGLSIADLQPEEFMMTYSDATGFEDWDNLDSHAASALTAALDEIERLREVLKQIASYSPGTVDAGMSPWEAEDALKGDTP